MNRLLVSIAFFISFYVVDVVHGHDIRHTLSHTRVILYDVYVFNTDCTNWELDSYLKQMSVFRLFNFGFIFPFHLL